MNGFTDLADLASERVGGKAVLANDEFFAPKGNLVKPSAPVFIPDKFTPYGKWMDGWETRRRRSPGHDWCVVRLGLRGIVKGLDVNTRFFTGNYPEHCSLEAADLPRSAKPKDLERARWTEILPRTPLSGDGSNLLPVHDPRPWTHVRLNIYPDGGVARLRVYGDVAFDLKALVASKKPVDLAAIENGGLVLSASDQHFGSKENLIMPGRAANMGDGWETRRRRGPGHDWAIVKLGAPGLLEKIEVDTGHFKGNYPESCSIEGLHAPGASLAALTSPGASWVEILPRIKLGPDARRLFSRELAPRRAVTHVRLNIYPDGGVSRLRLYGRVAAA